MPKAYNNNCLKWCSRVFNCASTHMNEHMCSKHIYTILQYVNQVYALYTESINAPTHETNVLRCKIYV